MATILNSITIPRALASPNFMPPFSVSLISAKIPLGSRSQSQFRHSGRVVCKANYPNVGGDYQKEYKKVLGERDRLKEKMEWLVNEVNSALKQCDNTGGKGYELQTTDESDSESDSDEDNIDP